MRGAVDERRGKRREERQRGEEEHAPQQRQPLRYPDPRGLLLATRAAQAAPSRLRKGSGMFAFTFVLGLSIAGYGTGQHLSDQSIEVRCRRFHMVGVCSEALGRWIRRVEVERDIDRTRTSTHVLDGFSSPRRMVKRSWSTAGLVGTQVIYGQAGPSRGAVIYDRRHALAFYGGGCCAYGTIVLASGISPPPVRVMNADLRSVKPDTGLRLGDSPARVRAVYGATPFRSDAAHPNVAYLLYQKTGSPQGPCVQEQTFGFTGGRLSYIELWSGC